MSSRIGILSALSLALILAACDDDPAAPKGASPGHIVVLNGQLPTGVSVIGDTGGVQSRVDFSDFDGASFSLRNDTVISAASKSKGDLLYVADLGSGSALKVQLPVASNPANAQFVTPGGAAVSFSAGTTPGTRLFVALRDSAKVATVLLPPGGSPVVSTLAGAGACPVDVVVGSSAAWAVDANQRCASDYALLGSSRLLPLPNQGSSDTIPLGAAVVSAQRAFVSANRALVMSAGDFFSIPGALARIDLATRVVTTRALPTDAYGVSLRLGANGIAYVTAAPSYPAPFLPRVYAIDPATMAFTGVRAGSNSYLRLVKSGGADASCYAATADANGNVYCLENGNTLATLLVFNAAGDQIRAASAGSLAYDITLR